MRAGTIVIPPAHRRGRVRVIVRLAQPPLAAARSTYTSVGAQRRLNVADASSRAYLARLARAQVVASAALRRAIPEAKVSSSFRVLVNGLTVELPATRLPALARLGFVTKIYPSLRYSVSLNRSPAVMARRHVHGGHRRPRHWDQDRRRRRRRRPREPVLRACRLPVSGRLPQGRPPVDDPEGDRRPRVPGPRLRPARAPPDRSPRQLPRHARRGHRSREGRHDLDRRPRPPARHRSVRDRAERLDRQLPRLQRPHRDRQHRADTRDRRRLRGGRARRDERDQLLGRRADDRSRQRRARRGGLERLGRRRRAGHLGRQRPRRFRPRLGRRPGRGAGLDRCRGALELPRLRPGADGRPAACSTTCRPAGSSARRLRHERPPARRHRHHRRTRRAAGRPSALRDRLRSERGDQPAAARLARRRDRARLAWNLRDRHQGPAGAGGGGCRDGDGRQPRRRGQWNPVQAAVPRRHDLRPRRGTDPGDPGR